MNTAQKKYYPLGTTDEYFEALQNPEDTPHARTYDRLTEMCTSLRFTGENFRKAHAQAKMERLKTLLNGKQLGMRKIIPAENTAGIII